MEKQTVKIPRTAIHIVTEPSIAVLVTGQSVAFSMYYFEDLTAVLINARVIQTNYNDNGEAKLYYKSPNALVGNLSHEHMYREEWRLSSQHILSIFPMQKSICDEFLNFLQEYHEWIAKEDDRVKAYRKKMN